MALDQRATGLGAIVRRSVTHTISRGRYAGKTIELQQPSLKDIAQTQEEACERFKRSQLKTYTENSDLIPQEFRGNMIRDAFAAAAEIHYSQLPRMRVDIPVVGDDGRVKIEDGQAVTRPASVEYGMWWTLSTIDGMLFAVWLAMRKCPGQEGISLDEVDSLFMESPADLNEAMDKLGALQNQRVLGNENAPAAAEQPAREMTRRERRAMLRRKELLTGT